MKKLNLLIAFIMIILMMLNANYIYGQATGDNNIGGTKFLGFNAGQNLEVRTNNTTYMQMMQNGNSTINGFTVNRSGFVGLSQDPIMFTSGVGSPFSLLHLNGDNNGVALTNGYRSWMKYGLTYTHNKDLMFVGQRAMGNYDVTDAVIAWADNSGEFSGPDNLCFVFTSGDGTSTASTDPNSNLGRETARMTAIGHTGIGINWTNILQPKRTLDVIRQENVPQFRITRRNTTTETGGIYTDFETSGLGHLHILPRNAETKNVGIGFLSGTSTPTERVDVYDGTARLRKVPANEPHVLITGRKQDENPTNGDYVLNYLEFSQDPNAVLNGVGDWINVSGGLCDWDISGQNLTTGHPMACHTGNVGIGIATPNRKLDVLDGVLPTYLGGNPDAAAGRFINTNPYNRPAGVLGLAIQENANTNVTANTGGFFQGANAGSITGSNYGVFAVANALLPQSGEWVPSARESIGVRALSSLGAHVFGVASTATQGSERNFGVSGYAHLPVSGAFNVGVAGRADCTPGFVPEMNIGVYGEAQNGCGLDSNQNYAGYFAGSVMINGNAFYFSDAALKTNVQEIEGALNTINQLMPKTYNYLTEENQSIGLPSGQQYGLIAQEVAEVLPNLTQLVGTLPQIDSIGNVLTESNEFLAINYTGLIPVLISGMKEQQAQIAAQDESIAQLQESLNNQNEALAQMMDQLAAMQQQLNDCCNSGDGNRSMPSGVIQPQDFNNQKSVEGGNELFQNIPNPFRESTTISYSLQEGGRVQLSIYDNNGKVITTLTDANQGPGRYSEVWNANGMPSGVYHYALYVNGELLVKRAIKLQE